MLRCQCNQSLAPSIEKWIGTDQERANVLWGKRSEGCFNFLIGAAIEND